EARYREMQEQEEISLHDELNEKLRDKSGRISYQIGLLTICISELVFSFLGKAGVITDHKIIVLYLFALFVFQIVLGSVVYCQLRKKY
ncbi:MAG: hypothetical protein K6C08_00480, partial [Oscillospiraceae bacterium]|nr:hypothetical protein [Oscillospiraceae bacterium]